MQNRQKILDKTRKYINEQKKQEFIPGETYIPSTKKMIDGDDVALAVDAVLDAWFTDGRFAKERYNKQTITTGTANAYMDTLFKELVDEVPCKLRFSLFGIKKVGIRQIYQMRCRKCNTILNQFVCINEEGNST